ncbi:Histone H4.2 [Escovopsis weberi]|uniref:Histone H4 n=1 Tax=Escovopsis weberi TaxID=150374 RepID=A0A0N0RT51_ESCWE|nr:Histone H4.2 [Escovopsis weberi]
MAPPSSYRGGPSKKGTAKPVVGGGKARFAGKTVMGGKMGAKRHRKVLRDSIRGITKPDIRRLARRGGVKRISAMIYDETRLALRSYMEKVLDRAIIYVEHRQAKTVTVNDILYSLRAMGRTLYGFDPDSWSGSDNRRRQVAAPSSSARPHRADRIRI